MDTQQLETWLRILGYAGGAAGTVWAFLHWVWPALLAFFKAVANLFQAVQSLPHVLATVASIEDLALEVRQIRAAVYPNGGSSVPDSQKRVERALEVIGAQLASSTRNVNLMAATIRVMTSSDPQVATFETDGAGLFVEVNKTLTRWTGRQPKELDRWGWINTVHQPDQIRVRAEYEQGVKDCRQFTIHFGMVGDEGEVFEVDLTATPIPEDTVPCEKYMGQIRRTLKKP